MELQEKINEIADKCIENGKYYYKEQSYYSGIEYLFYFNKFIVVCTENSRNFEKEYKLFYNTFFSNKELDLQSEFIKDLYNKFNNYYNKINLEKEKKDYNKFINKILKKLK